MSRSFAKASFLGLCKRGRRNGVASVSFFFVSVFSHFFHVFPCYVSVFFRFFFFRFLPFLPYLVFFLLLSVLFCFSPFFPCLLLICRFRFFPFFPFSCVVSVSFRFVRFLPFSSAFFRFLPFSSVLSVSLSEKKRGDTVRESPFAKPQLPSRLSYVNFSFGQQDSSRTSSFTITRGKGALDSCWKCRD